MMYRIISLFFVLSMVSAVGAAFLPATEDIPLMAGITLVDSDGFAFDTPAGQILTFEGKTNNSVSEIRSFYDETLQSLGWKKKRTDFYERGNDTLKLYFVSKKEVRFDILLSNN